MQDGRELGFVSPEAGTDFLLFCVRPIQATVSKLDSSPICSVMHTLLLVGCKTPLLRQGYVTIPVKNYHYYQWHIQTFGKRETPCGGSRHLAGGRKFNVSQYHTFISSLEEGSRICSLIHHLFFNYYFRSTRKS